MSSVRAKFTVSQMLTRKWGTQDGQESKTIILEAKYDPLKSPEDVGFSLATPNGKMEIQIDNPAAIAAMPVGAVFYVDFTPA